MSTTTLPPKWTPESDAPPPRDLRMTEEQFVAWCDEKTPAEWVDGKVIIMPPVSDEHDTLQWWLRTLMQFYADRHDLGVVKGPEFQVRLPNQRSRRGPDVLFIAKARRQIIQRNHLEGPPDLIMEIVSTESESRDRREKYLEYQAAGVREYWIVDPIVEQVEAHALTAQGAYEPIREQDGKLPSTVLPGWHLRPEWLWREKLPDALQILAELGVR